MKDFCELFRGKKITVLGFGLLGRGVGDVEFLATCGAKVLVTDLKSKDELAESVSRLKKYPNVTFHLGGHDVEDFKNADMVIKAAGVPLVSPEIAAARAAGIPIVMSTALFAKYAAEASAILVGVTGTRGKSTVAHMIFHTLKQAGKRVHLGGNVRGVSTLALLPQIQAGDFAVLELDSWQLQGFGDLKISPHIAVFTNLMPDHQDYYLDMDSYFADKANIFQYQKEGDTFIAGNTLIRRLKTAQAPVEPLIPSPLPPDWQLNVPGKHNRENAACAAAALKAVGLPEAEIRLGIESFEGIEGRLQFVGEINDVKIYNDNNATTPEATIAALRAVGDTQRKNVVLVVGGDDKQLDMSALVKEIPRWCSAVVLFKERGTDHIRDEVFAFEPDVHVYEEEGLKATVERAFEVAKPRDTILYSPAFSSFGKYFKNEFDRGDLFLAMIRKRMSA